MCEREKDFRALGPLHMVALTDASGLSPPCTKLHSSSVHA